MKTLLLAGFVLAIQPADPPVRAEIADLAWLEGCWEGEGFGNTVEECWMSAPDGRLTGVFQMIGPDGSQTMSEIFVLDMFEDGPAIRLKHFNPDMTGWEAQHDYMVFELIETGEDFARFEGLDYRLENGRLIVDLVISHAGQERVERLEFDRVR